MKISEKTGGEDNVSLSVYDTERIEVIEPRFPDLSPSGQMAVLSYCKPIKEKEVHNTFCEGADLIVVDMFDATTGNEGEFVDYMVVGDDATAPAYSNQSINNKVAEIDITEYEQDGIQLIVNGLLGTQQANSADNEITEMGTKTENDTLINHATFQSFEKNENRAATLEVTLTFDSS